MTPLFALTFGAGALLGGMAFAGLPILIHLLHRRKHREMQWAAMEWLLKAMKRNQKRIRLEQWLLLALRTLLIVLVVLAMARPALETVRDLTVSTSATHNVIVLDNTLSMHYAAGDVSRWRRAKTLAQEILDGAQKGDLASVVAVGAGPTVLVGEASPYLTTVAKEIDALPRSDGKGDLGPALDKVAEILQGSRAAVRQVYLITDMQRELFRTDAAADSGLRDRLLAIGEQASCHILDVGGAVSPNAAVTAVALDGPLAVTGRSTLVQAEVANFGPEPLTAARVSLRLDDQVEQVQTLDLPAAETRTVSFSLTPREPGDRVVEVSLDEDRLPTDDRRWLVLRVRDAIDVLLVDGDRSGEPFRSETDYLHVALSPEPDPGVSPADALIRTQVADESDLLETRLGDFDLVVLANVGQLTPAEAGLLADFVRGGGGVLFTLGDRTVAAAFNRVLYADGAGLLPGKLVATRQQPLGAGGRREAAFTLDPLEYRHPIAEPFRDFQEAGLLTARFFEYWKLALPEDSAAQRVLDYDTGDPALVVASFGRGRVGVLTTSADLEWNAWAINPSFVPVMRETVRRLIAGRVAVPSALVGDAIAVPLPPGQPDAVVEVRPPGEGAEPYTVRREADGPAEDGLPTVSAERTPLAGIYRLERRTQPPLELLRAVNAWPEESDLARIGEDDLKASYPGWQFDVSAGFDAGGSVAADLAQTGEIAKLLLYAALALALLETVLAWRFSHHRG